MQIFVSLILHGKHLANSLVCRLKYLFSVKKKTIQQYAKIFPSSNDSVKGCGIEGEVFQIFCKSGEVWREDILAQAEAISSVCTFSLKKISTFELPPSCACRCCLQHAANHHLICNGGINETAEVWLSESLTQLCFFNHIVVIRYFTSPLTVLKQWEN